VEYVAFEQQLFVTGVEPAFADILAAEAEHAVRFVVAFVATTEIPAPVVAFGAFVVGIPEEVAEVFGFEAVDIVAGWVEQAVESDELADTPVVTESGVFADVDEFVDTLVVEQPGGIVADSLVVPAQPSLVGVKPVVNCSWRALEVLLEAVDGRVAGCFRWAVVGDGSVGQLQSGLGPWAFECIVVGSELEADATSVGFAFEEAFAAVAVVEVAGPSSETVDVAPSSASDQSFRQIAPERTCAPLQQTCSFDFDQPMNCR
jgi:hypothetical protein